MGKKCRGIVGRFIENLRTREELTMEWQVRNFFSLSVAGTDFYISPRFFFRNAYWCFCLNPCDADKTTEEVSISLLREDEGFHRKISPPMLGIKGWDEKEMKKGFDPECYGLQAYCWTNFCSRSYLKRQKYKLMPADVLTFICELKVNDPSPDKDVSSQTNDEIKEILPEENKSSPKQDVSAQTDDEIKEVLPEENKCSPKKGMTGDICKDIGKLLASGECSDTVVQVNDVEFRVHRAILSVRSPVLHAAFRHDTAERATNRISVTDCEPDVFREYLRYVYSGSVRSLTSENVFGLYRLADMYLAEDLKMRCLEHIQNTLCVETFCNALQLALTHGENDLLKLAIEFASKNFRSILPSVEWQNFIREYPTEANEILIKCYPQS